MNLLDHNAQGATFHLDQRELLMVMALVQEGRDSFECEGKTGRAIEQLFCSAVVMVEEARYMEMKKNGLLQKVGQVAEPQPDLQQEISNG